MTMTISEPLSDEQSPDGVASLALALRSLYDQHRRIRLRFASRLGLTPTEFSALLILAEQGDLAPKVLATELDITPSAVTAMLGHLEQAGFVSRMMHPTDRRSVMVTLTGGEGRPATWVLDEYNASVEAAVRDFAFLATPEITEALLRTATAMRSLGN
jgi:DNA-binding MarR family transcriptional regulator